jgi:agmatinase
MFDPNGIGVANGNIFGFPLNEPDAELIIIPVPVDITSSYGTGSANGPEAILDASTQLDFYHSKKESAWKSKIFMLEVNQDWKSVNEDFKIRVQEYLNFLEQDGDVSNSEGYKDLLEEVNIFQNNTRLEINRLSKYYLSRGKKVAVLGGDHSSPLGLIESYDFDFGVLQIDAHADLRDCYEGFEQSHASIMTNALQNPSLSKLVQVGIRDYAPIEAEKMAKDFRIESFTWSSLSSKMFEGETWKSICDSIIEKLPQRVYISFDIDGLEPALCPNTGTPVPGGLSFDQAKYLFWKVKESGREIIGFDLCEVAPGSDTWDANVGARVLWELCLTTAL